jgi:Fe-S-cluster containining protein
MIQHPDLCALCGGRCCRAPAMMAHEVLMMVSALDIKGQKFVAAGPGWFRPDHDTCPALGEAGCRLEPEVRPIACQLYPFQFATLEDRSYMIFLDVRICPHWAEWGEDYAGAEGLFKEYMQRVRDATRPIQRDETRPDGCQTDH